MAFKARKGKNGFEVHGIEEFIEKKLTELRKALGVEAARVAKVVKAKTAAVRKAVKAATTPAPKKPLSAHDQLVRALEAHPRREALVKAGKQKDQLLRALIPLYVGRSLTIEISSGETSKLWAKYGVKFAAPNAAKALREHVGYARRTKVGTQITPNGVKYVEDALAAKRAA
jgi:hypothetical protein